MIRRLWKLLAGIVILVVILVIALYLTIDSIAKAGIEKGGTYALGVNTKADSVGVSLLGGSLGVGGLTIDNPKGYKGPLLLKSGRLDVDVNTGTLFSQVIEIPRIEMDDLELSIEPRAGGNNVSDVIQHIESLGSKGKTEGGRRVKIGTILLKNVTAKVQLLAGGGDASTITVNIPELELKNVTEGNQNGILVSDVMARVFPAIVAGILEKGKGIIPVDLAGQMGKDIAGAAKTLGEGGAKLVGQTAETLGKAAEGAEKALEGLFGKKKTDAP